MAISISWPGPRPGPGPDLGQLAGSKRFRALRKALGPVHKAMSAKDERVLAYARERMLRMEEEGRRARQAAHDRHHLDTTGLRKGRIDRLKQLCEADGDAGSDRGRRAITMSVGDGSEATADDRADGDADGGEGGALRCHRHDAHDVCRDDSEMVRDAALSRGDRRPHLLLGHR